MLLINGTWRRWLAGNIDEVGEKEHCCLVTVGQAPPDLSLFRAANHLIPVDVVVRLSINVSIEDMNL